MLVTIVTINKSIKINHIMSLKLVSKVTVKLTGIRARTQGTLKLHKKHKVILLYTDTCILLLFMKNLPKESIVKYILYIVINRKIQCRK